jgi:mRNA-degrading endonuclease RelE of RelBE toxin-antitoxin system
MTYNIEYTENALRDLEWLRKAEQVIVLAAIDEQLRHEPTVETRNRKQLRPNPIAEWELRVGVFRVLYDVDEVVRIVEVQRVGRKPGSQYSFRGEEAEL